MGRWIAIVRPARWSPHFVHLPEGVHSAGNLWFEAAIDGAVLIDPSGRITAWLARARRAIAAHELVRRMRHGHAYWEKKT